MIRPITVISYESAKLTKDEWDKLIAICLKISRRYELPTTQTDHHSDHWLSNYMKYVDEVSNDR